VDPVRSEALAWRHRTNGMSHIGFSEALDGKTVAWMEQASEEQYRR
jgi:hypothetical protein